MADFVTASFVGTDGTELSAHDASWSKITGATGSAELTNANRLRATNTTTAAYVHSGTPASANYEVRANVYFASALSGNAFAISARNSTTEVTHYRLSCTTAGSLTLAKAINNSFESLGSSSFSPTVGSQHQLKMVLTGNLIECYTVTDTVETLRITYTDNSGTAILTAGKAGFRYTASSAQSDTTGIQVTSFGATDSDVAITVPDAPTIAFTVPDVGGFWVYFDPGASDGGAPVTLFTAESVAGPGTYSGSGTTSPVFVEATAGTTAAFTVKAKNSEGESAASDASASVTSLGAAAAVFHGRPGWQAPEANNGGVTWDKSDGVPVLRHGINARRQVLCGSDSAWGGAGFNVSMRYVGTHDRTYIGHTNSKGEILASAFDHKTGEIIGPVVVRSGLVADDHNTPYINVLPDGRLIWSYTERSAAAHVRITASPEDILAWDAELTVDPGNCNYCNTKVLGSRLYVFYAKPGATSGFREAFVRYSDDWGETFTSAQRFLIDNAGWVYYGISEVVDSQFDITAFSQLQTVPVVQKNVRSGIMREVGGVLTLFKADNTTQLWEWGDPAIDYDLMTSAYDTGLSDDSGPGNYSGSNSGFWRWSSSIASMLIVERATNRQLRFARLVGGVWDHFAVTDMGAELPQHPGSTNTYSGAAAQDARVYGRVYVSKPIDPYSGGLYQYDVDDPDAETLTWSLTRVIAPADYPLNMRPSSPRNYHESLPLLWASGVYRGFDGHVSSIDSSEFALSIVCEPINLAGHGFFNAYVLDNTDSTAGNNQTYPRNHLTKTGSGSLALSSANIHGKPHLDFSTANDFYFVDTAIVDTVVDETEDLTQIAFVTDINPAAVSYFHSNRSASTSDGQDLRSNTSAALIVQALTNTDTSDAAVLPATPVMLSLVNDGTGLTAKGYIDDVEHVSVTTPSGNYLDRFMVGAGQAGASATISDLSHAIQLITPKKLTEAELSDIAALQDAGSYTSHWKSIATAGTGSPRVTVQADIPTGTSATLTVYENTGTLINESDPVTLVDGEDTYTLTGLEGGAGNLYQFKFEPETTDRTVGAAIEYVTIEPGAEPPSLGTERLRYGPTWDGTLLYNRTWGEAPAVEVEAETLAATATALIVGAFLVTTLADSFTLDPPLRLNAPVTQSIVGTLTIVEPSLFVIDVNESLDATGAPSITGETAYETDPLFSMGHVTLQSSGVPSVLGEFGYTYPFVLENGVAQTTGACGVSGSLVIVGPVFLEGLVSCVVTYADSSSPIPVYDAEDLIRIIATFTDGNTGDAGTPVNVAFNIRYPDGTVSAITPTQESVGVYSVGLTPTLEGNYRFNWKAQGVVQVGQFVVQPSLVAT